MTAKNGRLYIQQGVNLDNVDITSIQDTDGNVLNVTDGKQKTLPKKILLTVEATHTGVNRNLVEYVAESLEKSTDSWTNNYNKPVLLNHDSYSDPLGRVLGAEFKNSVINPNKQCIQLSLEITNQAAIERFLDGRYKTFSIGGYTDSAVCSVCGKDIMKHGFCGHRRGAKYDNKTCHWILGQMDYEEISVVNCPADVHAQSIDIKVVGEDGQLKDFVENPTSLSTQDSAGSPLDNIDGILGLTDNAEENPEAGNEGVVEDGAQDNVDNTDGVQGDEGKTSDENAEGEDGVVEDENSTSEQLAKMQKEIDELKETNKKLQDENLVMQESVTALTNEKESLVAEKDTLNKTVKELKDQNLSLAHYSHSMMAERVADMQILIGEKSLEEKDSLIEEYKVLTSKKLNDMLKNSLTVNNVKKTITKATSPGIVQNAEEDSVNETVETNITLNDYADRIIKGIVYNGIGGNY